VAHVKTEYFTGNLAYSIPAYSSRAAPHRTLGWRGVVDRRSDLLGEDVRVAGVAGDLTDHAEVDEAESHRTDETVFGGVVEGVVGSDFIRCRAGLRLFVNNLGQGFVVGNLEAVVAADRMASAVFKTSAGQGALKPDPFGGCAVLNEGDGSGQGGHEVQAGLSVGQAVDGGDELRTM
jgi:hypothetical protein